VVRKMAVSSREGLYSQHVVTLHNVNINVTRTLSFDSFLFWDAL